MLKIFFKVVLLWLIIFNGIYALENKDQDVIIIAAPTVEDLYEDEGFSDIFYDIIDFDIKYANAIYGKDKVFIIVDEKTKKYFKGKVPNEVLIVSDPLHIWMRDYTTINPYSPVQFRYTPVTFENEQEVADEIQNEFNQFLKELGIRYSQAYKDEQYLMLDGGNVVDDYKGKVVITTRFLEDNNLTHKEAITILKKELKATQVALIPTDDPILAHSDGMVMFGGNNTLFVNRYDEPFRSEVLDILKKVFPKIKIIELEANFDTKSEGSACGINLNAVVTTNYIYMPHFGDLYSDKAYKTIQEHTSKQVIPILANGVCKLGGTVRCLSWQQSGKSAKKIISAIENLK